MKVQIRYYERVNGPLVPEIEALREWVRRSRQARPCGYPESDESAARRGLCPCIP